MYWIIQNDGDVKFLRYGYEVVKYIEHGWGGLSGDVDRFDLHPDLQYWVSDITPSYGVGDDDCMCRKSLEDVFEYVQKRLWIEDQKRILLERIKMPEYKQYVRTP